MRSYNRRHHRSPQALLAADLLPACLACGLILADDTRDYDYPELCWRCGTAAFTAGMNEYIRRAVERLKEK